MNPRVRRWISGAALVTGGAALMLFGEAAVRPEQTARADQWQYYISTMGQYCEGCCGRGSLCCEFPDACRREPLQPSTGG